MNKDIKEEWMGGRRSELNEENFIYQGQSW